MNEQIFLGGASVRGFALGSPTVTWVDWYNAHGDQQGDFDKDVAALESDPSSTPQQKENYINVFGGSDDEKEALRNYVATGGRAALFAKPAKNYGTQPIAVIKPNGPIEKTASQDGVVLHPGTYTYSNVTSAGEGFDEWVRNNAKTIKNTVVQSSASVLPGGASYYSDNLFVVYQDTVWPSSLSGLPTWLPPGTDPVQYWGKVTPPAPPNWDLINPPSTQSLQWVGVAAAVTAVVVGGVLIVYYVPRRQERPAFT